MPKGVTYEQPISLIDVYPTFIDLCDLPLNPHQGRSGYPPDGYSIKPLLLDPADSAGKWTGPEVAITALPGKDHSQHRGTHSNTLPAFLRTSKGLAIQPNL